MINDVIVSAVLADIAPHGWHFWSNLNIVYCGAGAEVWVRATGGYNSQYELR